MRCRWKRGSEESSKRIRVGRPWCGRGGGDGRGCFTHVAQTCHRFHMLFTCLLHLALWRLLLGPSTGRPYPSIPPSASIVQPIHPLIISPRPPTCPMCCLCRLASGCQGEGAEAFLPCWCFVAVTGVCGTEAGQPFGWALCCDDLLVPYSTEPVFDSERQQAGQHAW